MEPHRLISDVFFVSVITAVHCRTAYVVDKALVPLGGHSIHLVDYVKTRDWLR
jgi:hypothetical protein